MNKKIISVIMSGLLSLGLVACSNNQYLKENNTEKQAQELNEELVEDISKDIVKEKDKEESGKEETNNLEETKVKEEVVEEEWHCPICGYSDCPDAEEIGNGDQRNECLRYCVCDLCCEGGLLDDMEVWTLVGGNQVVTHKGTCTNELKVEDANDRASFNCEYCYDTGIMYGGEYIDGQWVGPICDACHCRGCGELIEDCCCGAGWNVVYCPQCGTSLGPNGTSEKCADCGYGY